MAWPQSLIDLFARPNCTEALASFVGNEGRARRVSVLLNNPAVGGNQEIAELIADSCDMLCFTHGQYLFEQDDIGDDVFYLLAGEADVVLNGEKITYRQAPTQVGEMAARSPGKARTASVSARSKVLVVAKLSGGAFREIELNHPEFAARLTVELDARYRERLAAQKVYAENNSVVWTLISLAAAIIVGLAVWTFAIPRNWSTAAGAIASIGAGFVGFLLTLLRNPAFIWRHLAYFIGIATVGFVVLGRQIRLITDGAPFETATFEIVSDSGDENWQTLLIKIGAMVLLFGIAAIMDWQRSRR